MFKAIKEFFVGKPKVEEKPAECPYKPEAVVQPEPVVVQPEPVVTQSEPTMASTPPVEEVTVTTVTLNDKIAETFTVSTKTDVISTGSWPFPGGDKPVEEKKKRTFAKREESITDKKPTPPVKVNKNKPRKKK